MQIFVSLCTEPDLAVGTNKCFAIYDTSKKQIIRILELPPADTVTRGTGMCYSENHWYGICLAKEHRVGSKLIAINFKTGKKTLNSLHFSKAVHSICHFTKCGHYDMLLANSTQNDTITIITLNDTVVETEDLYFDYLTNKERLNLKWCNEYVDDDFLHNNDVYKHGDTIYTSMFLDYKYKGKGKTDKEYRKTEGWQKNEGAIYHLTKEIPMYNKTSMPHSILWDSRGDMLFCESGTFSLINIHRHIAAKTKGFTRGLVEDKEKGGYWVGLSYHRKLSTSVDCAMLQFVSYDMELGECLTLKDYKEIYDLLPFKEGRYNG